MSSLDATGTPSISLGIDHPVTVLLVDDQPFIAEAVRRMLSSEADIIFHYCSDPVQAIPTAMAVSPSVILQDLVMPEVDGLTLLQFLRANSKTREVPVILLSTKEEAQIKARGFALGASDYLVKLPDKIELIARIRHHSAAYTRLLQRNEAYQAIQAYSRKLETSNELIRKVFGRYLSDEVVDELLESPTGLALGGERRQVTILTSDLRGFTANSDRIPPEEVIQILNFYFSAMVDVIGTYQGTIDEYMGDGILVLFGAPQQRANDAERAVACAVAMQLALDRVNQQLRDWGLPTLEMGIGIHTGEVVVGNIGSEKRAKYGVVGGPVNLTFRIESYTTGGQIYISEQTLQKAGPVVQVNSQREVTPKGFKQPITIYEVGGVGEPYHLALSTTQEVFRPLAAPLPIQFVRLDGKHVGDAFQTGTVVSLSERGAVLQTEPVPPPLSDLKLNLLDDDRREDCYGKVLDQPAPEGCFCLRFTNRPPAIAARMAALYGQ